MRAVVHWIIIKGCHQLAVVKNCGILNSSQFGIPSFDQCVLLGVTG
jgi:hypothetical protein